MNKPKKKPVIVIILSACAAVAIIYSIFLYSGVQYSVGRSLIDARIRVFLGKVSKVSADRNFIVSELKKYSPNHESEEYIFSIHEGVENCFNIDELCVKATSVPKYRGKHDIFVLGLKNGKIVQVENMGPDSFWDWVVSK